MGGSATFTVMGGSTTVTSTWSGDTRSDRWEPLHVNGAVLSRGIHDRKWATSVTGHTKNNSTVACDTRVTARHEASISSCTFRRHQGFVRPQASAFLVRNSRSYRGGSRGAGKRTYSSRARAPGRGFSLEPFVHLAST